MHLNIPPASLPLYPGDRRTTPVRTSTQVERRPSTVFDQFGYLPGETVRAPRPDVAADKRSVAPSRKVAHVVPAKRYLEFSGIVSEGIPLVGMVPDEPDLLTLIDLSTLTWQAPVPIILDHDWSKPVGQATVVMRYDNGLFARGVVDPALSDACGLDGLLLQASTGVDGPCCRTKPTSQFKCNGRNYTGVYRVFVGAELKEISIVRRGAAADRQTIVSLVP